MASKFSKAYDRSRVPLYLQVASVLRDRIASGQWIAGAKISPLRELELEFGVARITIRQAVETLAEEGLLWARQGLGTFVAETLHDKYSIELATNWREMVDSLDGNVPRRVVVEYSATPPILSADDGRFASAYVKLQSVQYQREKPYSAVRVWLAKEIFRRNPSFFKKHPAVVGVDRMGIQVRSSYQMLTVGTANFELAEVLDVPIGAPTLNSHIVVVDDTDTAVYVSDVVYRSESIGLRVNLLGSGPAPKGKRPDSNSSSKTTPTRRKSRRNNMLS